MFHLVTSDGARRFIVFFFVSSTSLPNMKKSIALLAVVALLGGCALHTRDGSVVLNPYGVKSEGGRSGGKFCPPGQAKKGNC